MNRFLDDDRVTFLAGRMFTHLGKKVLPGEEITDAREWRNLESMVRSRYMVAVTEDPSVLPPRIRKDVHERARTEDKLQAERWQQWRIDNPEPEPEPVVDPEELKIKEILAHLDEHPEDTESILELERQGKNRSTLINELEERLTAPAQEMEKIDV